MGLKIFDPNSKNEINLRDIAPQLLGQQPVSRQHDYDTYVAFHRGERTGSLQVWSDHAHDYGTNGQHYTARQFLETFSNQPLDLPIHDPKPARRPAKPADLKQFKKSAQGSYNALHGALLKKPAVLAYVVARHSNPVRFGYAAHEIRIGRGKLPQYALCIFHRDAAGEIVRIKYRLPHLNNDGTPDSYARALGLSSAQVARANPENKKYSQVGGGDPKAPYIIPGNDVLVLVEGEFDTETAAASGYSAATRGSASDRWTLEQANALIDQIQPSVIFLAQDMDAAGTAAAAHCQDVFDIAAPHIPIIRLTLPDGVKDISEFVDAGGNLPDLIENHRAGGVGFVSFTHHPQTENAPHISTTVIVSTQDSPEFTEPIKSIPTGFKDLLPDGWKPEATTGQRVNYLDAAALADLLDMAESYGPLQDAYLFPGGMLPDVFRTEVLGLHRKGKAFRYIQDHAPLVILYELIHRGAGAGQLDPCDWSQAELKAYALEIGLDIKESTYRRGLAQLVGGNFCRNLNPIYKDNSMGSKNNNNSVGRPETRYTLVPIREALREFLRRVALAMRQAVFANDTPDDPAFFEDDREFQALLLEVDAETASNLRRERCERYIDRLCSEISAALDPARLAIATSTPLPDGMAWGKGSEYRTAYNAGLLAAVGGERKEPIKALADKLGCSENSVRACNRRANILSIDQFEPIEITPADDIANQVETAVFGRGRAWVYLDGERNSVITPDNAPDKIEGLTAALANGRKVEIVAQTVSLHKFAAEADISADIQRRKDEYNAIVNRKGQKAPEAAPVQVEIMPRPVDALSDLPTDQYKRDQYALRINVLDEPDPRRETLINRYVELGGEIMPFVDQSQPREKGFTPEAPTIAPVKITPIRPTPPTSEPKTLPSHVPLWVKIMTSQKVWERRGA